MIKKILISFILLFTLSISVIPVYAESLLGDVGKEAFGDTDFDPSDAPTTFYNKIGDFISLALQYIGVILLVIVIYAGFLWMTAGGNEEQVTQARKWIINASIGLAIVGLGYLIVGVVLVKVFE